MVAGFLEWLGQTRWSVALIESTHAWPVVESTHVLLVALFVGTVAMMDLRLLGVGFGSVPASDFTRRLLPWSRFAFVLMVLSGLLLFYSAPVRYYYNIFFRIKFLVMALAGVNLWVFHARMHRRIDEWDHANAPPGPVRLVGALSLASWAGVAVAGRLIAYNWFDCALQPQPAWVNWLAGCVLPE
jgi:hypothetical protein